MKEIIYKQRRSGMTYEHELKILAQVYRLALESYQRRKQKAAVPIQPSGRDDTDAGSRPLVSLPSMVRSRPLGTPRRRSP